MSTEADARLDLVARLTGAFGDELEHRDPAAVIGWAAWPDVAALTAHLGGIHRWVTAILRTRGSVARERPPQLSAADRLAWFAEGRAALLEALTATQPDAPCWVLGDRIGTAAFWRRRMVFENAKHLIDVRAAGGGAWAVAPELTPENHADGIDELFAEFLPRSRPTLPPLPVAVTLEATDVARSWRVDPDWTVTEAAGPGGTARVVASAGELALAVWQRADPLQQPQRFRVAGDPVAIAAFCAAPIHP